MMSHETTELYPFAVFISAGQRWIAIMDPGTFGEV
jgi:hypothetical protein